MTMTEKILARASQKEQVTPGDNIWVNVDILMTHDVCGPGSIGIFKNEFGKDAKVICLYVSFWYFYLFIYCGWLLCVKMDLCDWIGQ